MSRFALVEIHKDRLKFSAGHFMVYSTTERESLHGHDYQVNVAFSTLIEKNGMSFDIRHYEQKLLNLCKSLDYHFILPSLSEFLRLEETETQWLAHMGDRVLPFLKRDVNILAITNVTLEELSYWFLQQLTENLIELNSHKISGIKVRVFNGRSQSAASYWGDLAMNSHSHSHTKKELA